MPLLPVTCLMRQHCEYLILIHFSKQGIIKDYPFNFSYTCKVCIRMFTSFRCIHLENPADFYSSLLHDFSDLLYQSFFLYGCKFIEEGFKNIGRDVHDKKTEDKVKAPDPYPPVMRTRLNQ